MGVNCFTFALKLTYWNQFVIGGNHEIKRLSGGLRKKFGGPKRPARTALEDGCDEKKRFSIFDPRFGPYFSAFFGFFQKSQNRRFCFAIFSMKNASTEKTKYTTTESTEKRIKCTSPIFNFRNFVTEIFAKYFQKFSIFWKNKKRRILCYSLKLAPIIFSQKTDPP